eukprot:3277736-Rhodomonas_salina.1
MPDTPAHAVTNKDFAACSPTLCGPALPTLTMNHRSLVFGGPEDAEQIRVELWDHDSGSGSADDLMETA